MIKITINNKVYFHFRIVAFKTLKNRRNHFLIVFFFFGVFNEGCSKLRIYKKLSYALRVNSPILFRFFYYSLLLCNSIYRIQSEVFSYYRNLSNALFPIIQKQLPRRHKNGSIAYLLPSSHNLSSPTDAQTNKKDFALFLTQNLIRFSKFSNTNLEFDQFSFWRVVFTFHYLNQIHCIFQIHCRYYCSFSNTCIRIPFSAYVKTYTNNVFFGILGTGDMCQSFEHHLMMETPICTLKPVFRLKTLVM